MKLRSIKTDTSRILVLVLTVLMLPVTLKAQVVGQKDPLIMDRIVAVVGKYPIMQSDLENSIRDYQSQRFDFPIDPYCYVLENQLITKLLVTQAEIDSIMVTDDEVERLIDNKLQTYILQVGSQQALETMFNKSLLEIKKDFLKPQKENMIADKMGKEVTNGVKITPSEVQKFFKKLPANQIPLRPETMEIREIVMKPQVPEAEIVKVQDRLKGFRDRILKGESFETLAVLYSEDPGSAPRGGRLGLTPRSMLAPEFAAAAFNLKPGDVSRVVKSDFGYHIIQLIERRGDLIDCRHILLNPKPTIEEKVKVRKELDSIAGQIREGKLKFEDAALMYSEEKDTRSSGGLIVNKGDAQNSNPQNANTTWFEPQELPTEVLNAVRNLKVGEISQVFETRDSNNKPVYKVIAVKSRRPAHKADLKQDYTYLQNLALQEKEQGVLNEWIQKKQKNTYIRIDPDFRNCQFEREGWVK
jgi:peptidyl-prolyl cis-trans isomerase SurA